ncbi:MAG: outer-membrane lipoprotein carrier protein LolA [Elusimicrobiota bacterium]
MSKITRIVLGAGFLGWLGSGIPGHAETQPGLSQSEVIRNIQLTAAAVRSLECRFTEHIQRRGFPTETIQGRLRCLRPNKLRIDQRVPDQQLIVSDNRTLRIYTPAAGQLLTGDRARWLAQNGFPDPLLSFVSDFPVERWTERYTILFGGHDKGLYQLIFRPKRADDQSLELWVSDETFLPRLGHMPSDDNTIDILFDHLRVNPPIQESIFHPEIPKNTVIVPMPS